MRRRTFLAQSAILGFAGCMGRSNGGKATGLPPDPDSNDGYPPRFGSTPESRSIDTSSFATVGRNGIAVPLAPIDVTYYWYQRREARFVDARGPTQYNASHIYGAVLSPAPSGGQPDPVSEWPKDARIVCYCGCPHHLSSMRAANLISKGYENVYVINEGFWEWHERNYPMAGSEVATKPEQYVIRGRVPSRFAGETVWATHRETAQREAAPISADGTYHLELHFLDVGPDSIIVVESPTYRIEAPLKELTARVLSGRTSAGVDDIAVRRGR